MPQMGESMNLNSQPRAAALAALLFVAPLSVAQNAAPAQAGFDAARLQRIDQFIERKMAAGEISGGVTLVARNGRIVHLKAQGVTDIESFATFAVPFPKDDWPLLITPGWGVHFFDGPQIADAPGQVERASKRMTSKPRSSRRVSTSEDAASWRATT